MSRIAGDVEVPEDYGDRTAADKADWLWNTLILPTRHGPVELPPLRMPFFTAPVAELRAVVRRDELEKTLTRSADVMEPGRPKVIHAHGAVAQVALETDAHSPFTGLLAAPPAGGARGFLRLSLVASVARNRSYIPGLGLKLLIDGMASADTLAVNHTIGQGRDFDLFANSMTTDLTDEHNELRPPQRLMSRLFDRVSHAPRRLTVEPFTRHLADGSTVADPVTPARLVFEPTAEARAVFAGKAGVDFRLVLAGVAVGTALYDVIGVTGRERTRVGRLRTTTEFVSSDGGDRLFFRHVQAPEDRKQ